MKKLLFVMLMILVLIVIAAPGCPTPEATEPVETQPPPVETQPPPVVTVEETQPPVIETQPPIIFTEVVTMPPNPNITPEPTEEWHPDFVDDDDKFKDASLPPSGFGPKQDIGRILGVLTILFMAGVVAFLLVRK